MRTSNLQLLHPLWMDCITHTLLTWPWVFCQEQGGSSPKWYCWMCWASISALSLAHQAIPHVLLGDVTVTLSCGFRWMTNPLWTFHTLILHPAQYSKESDFEVFASKYKWVPNNMWIFSFDIQFNEGSSRLTYYLVHYSRLYRSEVTIIYETLIDF